MMAHDRGSDYRECRGLYMNMGAPRRYPEVLHAANARIAENAENTAIADLALGRRERYADLTSGIAPRRI